ncbi:MAG: response regulator [Chloroflexi bacterium]|nr:response regulator [Chloroflexota bacterium]
MKPLILVVDDEAYIREMLTMLLELQGFAVVEAVDGRDALEKIPDIEPDVIILDVMMPRMDGITLCQILRRDPETAHLPIIMLSGKTHLNAKQDGLAAGADYYLFKPMKTAELLANIHTVLALTAVPVSASAAYI